MIRLWENINWWWEHSDGAYFLRGDSWCALGVVAFICVGWWVVEEVSLTANIEGHERIRYEMSIRSPVESEGLVARAIVSNGTLAGYRAYNAKWWADLFIPDEYDTLEFIDIRIYDEEQGE